MIEPIGSTICLRLALALNEIRKLRRGPGIRQKEGRLHDLSGALVDEDDRAQTFAEFFDTRQWAVRLVTAHVSNVQLAPTLQLSNNDISSKEVVAAAKLLKMKPEKTGGLDELPPEFWKSICREDSPACKWAVELCNRAWIHTDAPHSWHEALVCAASRKVDVAMCENYRPISLLPIGYKLFASILLKRMVDAGTENRIWHAPLENVTIRHPADEGMRNAKDSSQTSCMKAIQFPEPCLVQPGRMQTIQQLRANASIKNQNFPMLRNVSILPNPFQVFEVTPCQPQSAIELGTAAACSIERPPEINHVRFCSTNVPSGLAIRAGPPIGMATIFSQFKPNPKTAPASAMQFMYRFACASEWAMTMVSSAYTSSFKKCPPVILTPALWPSNLPDAS